MKQQRCVHTIVPLSAISDCRTGETETRGENRRKLAARQQPTGQSGRTDIFDRRTWGIAILKLAFFLVDSVVEIFVSYFFVGRFLFLFFFFHLTFFS